MSRAKDGSSGREQARPKRKKSPAAKVDKLAGDVVVGKDILELLSSSMYVDPLTIYREYIQNAVDAIDEAVETGVLGSHREGRIDISLDHASRRAIVRDNGIGVTNRAFKRRLASLGASKKRGTTARGFRGVGRLAGLGYCQELIFRSKAIDETVTKVMKWDCRQLKALLSEQKRFVQLELLIHEIISVDTVEPEEEDSHFFEVELSGVRRLPGKDELLNETLLQNYIAQVCPVPFHPEFQFEQDINLLMEEEGAPLKSYDIFINGTQESIKRPFRREIRYSEERCSSYTDLERVRIEKAGGGVAALGWVAHHDYLGAIPKNASIRGLRARLGNLQIGDEKLFTGAIFREERFNSWCVGELHILDNAIVPNGRRDNFEQNPSFSRLMPHLETLGAQISASCRKTSGGRNKFRILENKINERLVVLQDGVPYLEGHEHVKQEIIRLIDEMKKTVEDQQSLFEREHAVPMQKIIEDKESAIEELKFNEVENLLDNIPPRKRKAYLEVFKFIYDCSDNSLSATSLIHKIIDKTSKKSN